MNYNFQVNISSIEKFSNELKSEVAELEDILDYLESLTNDMNDFFDTPASHKMQEGLLDYLRKSKIPCNELRDLSNKIDLFNKNYENIYKMTKKSVGDEV